jgi:hypothetical protein
LGWVRLTDEMLTRPVIGRNGNLMEPRWQNVYTAALGGMMWRSSKFTWAVSLNAITHDGDTRISATAHREWGWLMLSETGDVVCRFSHDTRYDNRPFYGLLEWLQIDISIDSPQFGDQLAEWSDADTWADFFTATVERVAKSLETNAQKLQEDANALKQKAALIRAF